MEMGVVTRVYIYCYIFHLAVYATSHLTPPHLTPHGTHAERREENSYRTGKQKQKEKETERGKQRTENGAENGHGGRAWAARELGLPGCVRGRVAPRQAQLSYRHFASLSHRCVGKCYFICICMGMCICILRLGKLIQPLHNTTMDILLGIKVKDSVIMATSKAVTRGISVLKADDDKTRQLTPHCLMGFTGEPGDTVQFAEYIQANMKLYSMRENNNHLSTPAVASFTRLELAKSLRSRKPFQVNVLIAGVDKEEPKLFQIDYLGTQVELPYAAHGYAGFYTFSLLDHQYKQGMSLDEGIHLLKQCIIELQKRMPIDFKGVYVKIINKDGITTLDTF